MISGEILTVHIKCTELLSMLGEDFILVRRGCIANADCIERMLFLVFALIMDKAVKPYLIEIYTKNILTQFCLILMVIGVYIAEMFFSANQGGDNNSYWHLMTSSLGFITVVLCVFFLVLFRESIGRNHESELMMQYEIQQIQYQEVVAEMESSRRI